MEEFFKVEELKLLPPKPTPDGNFYPEQFVSTQDLTGQLSKKIKDSFEQNPQIIFIGSLARNEFCPKSDLDVAIVKESSSAHELVRMLQKRGVKVRSRNLDLQAIGQWPLLEQLSLLEAEPLGEDGKDFIKEWRASFHPKPKAILQAMASDRLNRRKSFSLENVLEPNLKTGVGGLREIAHFFQIIRLFPELQIEPRVIHVMEFCRWFFLSLRCKQHLLGGQDFMQADLQIELADWMGYSDFRALMREVQLSLSRSLFYSEWVQSYAAASPARRKFYQTLKFKNPEQIRKQLTLDSKVLSLFAIRNSMDQVISPRWLQKNPKKLELWMDSMIGTKSSEEQLIGFFRSRVADLLDSRLRRLVGYNQHDQYHAYTADAHILNLLLEFKRHVKKPKLAGALKPLFEKLKKQDLSILAWTCYYHDLGKGSEIDHELAGLEFVKGDHRRFGRKTEWTREVEWLVENHLEFSKAAFRGDPASEKTQSHLAKLGLNPERVLRLLVFTYLDIRATHPAAWTPWKEKLLWQLWLALSDPQKTTSLGYQAELKAKYSVSLPIPLLNDVPFLILKKDLRYLGDKESFRFYRARGLKGKKHLWVRYFNPLDESGVLLKALRVLFQMGCSVEQAFVTGTEKGVYDWFLVESSVSLETLEKRSKIIQGVGGVEDQTRPRWTEISWISLSDSSWTLLLKGKDSRGLLMKTVQVLSGLGVEIISARAQTWGRQVEDVLELKALKGQDPERWLIELRSQLIN